MHFSGELLRPTSASHGTVPPSEPATRGRPTVLFWPPNPKACPASCRTSVISTSSPQTLLLTAFKNPLFNPTVPESDLPSKVPRNSGPAVGETVGKFSV